MITNDYRNTEYCSMLKNVKDKKKALEKKIKKEHPKQKIMYNKVHSRDTIYNKDFCNIYNCKCAYCGVSMDILPITLFEVDHFVAETLFDDKIKAGQVENLVLACYQCNRNKTNFEIVGEYVEKLCTDNGEIANVFFRDDDYYIKIKDNYIHDQYINDFYNKLQLSHETRRLDYLLINMQGLYKKLRGTIQGLILADAILMMQKNRNKFI